MDAVVAAQLKEDKEFYGWVRAVMAPSQSRDDLGPHVGAITQVAQGLNSGTTFRNAPTNFSKGMNPAGLVEGILQGVLQ